MLHTLRSFGRRVRLHRLPKTLLLNNIELKGSELTKVLKENTIERTWYKGARPYQNLAEILAATTTGKLVQVTPTVNYQPIMRLQNPKIAEMYPGYLTPAAKALLEEVGQRWRAKMNEAGLDAQIALAVTSLVRTQTYQNTIVRAGKLADPKSVHTRGEAFDIDGAGYYLGDIPINARQGRQGDFAQAFKELEAELPAPAYGDYASYQPQVHELLVEVLEEMHREDRLHFVVEYPDTTNQCLHICRNPRHNDPRRP